MKITLDISEEDIERIARSLDNQSRNREGGGHKRLADLFRGFLKRGPGQAAHLCDQMDASPVKDQPVREKRGR